MPALQFDMESPEPPPGLLDRYDENLQGGAVIAEILGLASLEKDTKEEEMSRKESVDNDSGFHVGRSRGHWCRDRLQELSEKAEIYVATIQSRADEKGIVPIESEQIAKRGRQCNWQQEDIDVTVRKFGDWINDDIATEMTLINRLGPSHIWNAAKKSDERKLLADLTPVLMTMPLAQVNNECILFSLNCDIIGSHATLTTTELL